jgi:hypothetical protein
MQAVARRLHTKVSMSMQSGAIDILLALKGEDSYGAGFWSGLFGGLTATTALLRRRTTKRLYFWAARP